VRALYALVVCLLTIYSSDGKIPTAFVVTGPNISSQGFLFDQLAARLKLEANGPVVVLRSGDASNLKSVLKILIRTATNQLSDSEDLSSDRDVSKRFCMI
jgi:origin recognition complex subunit 3